MADQKLNEQQLAEYKAMKDKKMKEKEYLKKYRETNRKSLLDYHAKRRRGLNNVPEFTQQEIEQAINYFRIIYAQRNSQIHQQLEIYRLAAEVKAIQMAAYQIQQYANNIAKEYNEYYEKTVAQYAQKGIAILPSPVTITITNQ